MNLYWLRPLSNLAVVVCSCGVAAGWWYKSQLPYPNEIIQAARSAPQQERTSSSSFDFDYGGVTYRIQPVAEYQLTGLVVSHNNTSGIGDIYHDSNSVDLKDLCLIWGSSFKNLAYQKVSFSSAPWTCYVKAQDRKVWEQFDMYQLSNNHLIGATAEVRRIIKSVRIGDQVAIRGQLVRYFPENQPGLARNTSMVRTDTGNGACEVIFVEEISILKRGNPGWNTLWNGSKTALGLVVAAKFLMFLFMPLQIYRPKF